MIREIFIGYEPREAEAFAVARASIRAHGGSKVCVRGLVLADLQRLGLYRRPTYERLGRMIDWLSITEDYNGEVSTEFANSRFFVPYLARRMEGWALFVDCDVMARDSLIDLFELCEAQPDKAVLCVKHEHQPVEASKMDNQKQTRYFRKNWSSVMAFNLGHKANERLTVEMLNEVPGRDLHRFCWLKDDEIGALPLRWNWLAQVSDPMEKPALVHWTLGGPWLPAFRDAPFSDEWRAYRDEWARGGKETTVWTTAPVSNDLMAVSSFGPSWLGRGGGK